MQVSVKVDTRQLENSLYLLAKESRSAPGIVIKEETKFIAQAIMKLTPPKNLAQGRKRVQGDLARIVFPLDAAKITWKPLKEAVEKKDVAKIAALVANSTKFQLKRDFTRDQGRMKEQHKKMRTRWGRINRGVRPVLVALVRDAAKYTKSVQKNVNWAKASFASAIVAAGGTVPKWVGKFTSKAGATVANFGENPRVVATAFNIKIPDFQRIVDNAVAQRVKITERKIERLVAGKAINLGFKIVEARK